MVFVKVVFFLSLRAVGLEGEVSEVELAIGSTMGGVEVGSGVLLLFWLANMAMPITAAMATSAMTRGRGLFLLGMATGILVLVVLVTELVTNLVFSADLAWEETLARASAISAAEV